MVVFASSASQYLFVRISFAASDSGRDSASLSTLKQACEVVDALEPSFRDALINSFCEWVPPFCSPSRPARALVAAVGRHCLRICIYVCQEPCERVPGGQVLGNTVSPAPLCPYSCTNPCRNLSLLLAPSDNRYKWFKRALRDMDGRYGTVLPKPWRMPQWFYLKFLKVTRMEVDKMLCEYLDVDLSRFLCGPYILHPLVHVPAAKFSPDTVNPAILVRALTQTQVRSLFARVFLAPLFLVISVCRPPPCVSSIPLLRLLSVT